MSILVVGNILKDVYLNLDSRTENFETDKNGIKWLNLGFDTSSHYFFHRASSFSGAAVSLEVFKNFEIPTTISNSNFNFDAENAPHATAYRYILTSEDNVTYFTPSKLSSARFIAGDTPPEYLFVDRSADLDDIASTEIIGYLENHPEVKLVLYLKNQNALSYRALIEKSSLIFTETPEFPTDNFPTLPFDKTIYLSCRDLTYKNITAPITVERIDKLTHLSLYSIAAATILASFIKGYTIEKSLRLAKLNIENSSLSSTLSLSELNSLCEIPDESLELIAATLMAPGKGILAADESGGSIRKKFEQLNIADTFANRHTYRNIFFTTNNIEDYLSGIILFDETARDQMDTGESIPDFLISHRIIPGIKVDEGLATFENSPNETYTQGLDTLPKRLREYYQMGLRFAKWRAAFNLALENGAILTPSNACITENCKILAEYASDCQSAGIVPIVEPELIYDGYYSIDDSATTTGKILSALITELKNYNVNLRACIIKCNMVLAGRQFENQSTPEEVGKATAEVLKANIPPEIAGIVFLSGGQTPEQATSNLAAILKNGPFPWPITFSFARALQDPALYAWQGDNNNLEKARQAFLDRLIANKEVLI
jgi:fructose-bisphosphate aldolase class I